MRQALPVLAAMLLVSCSSSPSAPAPTPTTPVVTPPVVVVTPTTPATPAPPTRDPQLFSQLFWNEFVHNAFDSPGSLSPLQRLTAAPMLYLKTVDEAGNPIDALTLQAVENAMRVVAGTWGGGQFGLAGVTRGTATMEGQHGWLTAKWPNPSTGSFCGRSQVGTDGGWIELNYLRQDVRCSCNDGTLIPVRVVKHELGHAFGYWHTDSASDLMFNGGSGCADFSPSAREVYHATLAYQSAIGTTTRVQSASAPVVIVD